MDDAKAMKSARGKRVESALDVRQNKSAIDAVFASMTPKYEQRQRSLYEPTSR